MDRGVLKAYNLYDFKQPDTSKQITFACEKS